MIVNIPADGGGRDVSKRKLGLSALELSSSHRMCAYACWKSVSQHSISTVDSEDFGHILPYVMTATAQLTSLRVWK